MKKSKPRNGRGGFRPNSGRPPKPDKEKWKQVTCVLRTETVEALKIGADSMYFGEFLQAHLDRYPPPSREKYLAILTRTPVIMNIKRRKVPVIISAGEPRRPAKPKDSRSLEERLRARHNDLLRKTEQS